MRKLTLSLLGVFLLFIAGAQNPATVFTIANKNITLPCGTNCTTITAQVPHVKQSMDYVLTRPAYVPFAYTTPGGTELTSIYTDDRFSELINLPFNVCFYGSTYSSLVMGSNAIITFDATNANTSNSWPLTTSGGSGSPVPIPYSGGTQNSAFSTYYPRASIMGPYHDIYPTNTANGLRKIEWRVEGVAPKRRFIGSYSTVPMFSCTTTNATSQIVIYEGTGIVEVYIKDKPVCSTWNSGLAILGIQNYERDKAVAADGKNCTVWGTMGMDSCYRFIPSGGVSRLKSAELVVNGTVVANADTSTLAAGVLNLNFPNVCPTADSTAYVIRVTYNHCIGDPPTDVVFTDTVFVKKNASASFTVSKTDATCSSNGSITVDVTAGTPPYEYSIDGGANWQSSNVFPNLLPGTYNATARSVGSSCPASSQQVTIALANTLEMTVAKVDANCTGGSITITASSGTAPYEYSINGGQSYQSSNVFNNVPGGTYNVTTKDAAGCTRSQQVTLAFTDNLTISQSQSAAICAGQSFTPSFTSNAASFSWSPTTGVSNSQALNPVLSPTTTTSYTLTATLGTCTQTRTVDVAVSPGAFINAGPDATIIAGDVYQMQASGSAGVYLWTPSSGLSSSAILNPTASPAITTTYTVRVTTGQGCFAEDNVTIEVVPYCLKPMNAFTPNGDGINELWLITSGNCLQQAKAQVFNRYGAKVFESNDYRNTWDGTYKGKPLPDGTYYYIIDYKLLNGKSVYMKGNVTILR